MLILFPCILNKSKKNPFLCPDSYLILTLTWYFLMRLFLAILHGISQTQVQLQLFETTPLPQIEGLIFLLLSKYSAVGGAFLYLQISNLEVSISHSGDLKLG